MTHQPNQPNQPNQSESAISRRKFIGAGAAVVVAGGAVLSLEACSDEKAQPTPRGNIGSFKHVVVIMFENRSFDCVFGSLHGSPGNPDPRINGIFVSGSPGTITNPGPDGPVAATLAPNGLIPKFDPGECYPDTNAQLFGAFIPKSNFGKVGCPDTPNAKMMEAPYNLPSGPGVPAMKGFVMDYLSAWEYSSSGKPIAPSQYGESMAYFDSNLLPTFHGLAKNFAVFDNWFCDVPSNTFANRSFFHSAQSNNYVSEPPILPWIVENDADTILNEMSKKSVPWKVYYDTAQGTSFTQLINYPKLRHEQSNFVLMTQFYQDITNNQLPSYSFIEPRMLTNDPQNSPENDMHPTDLEALGVQSDVRHGDLLLWDIYDAIRQAPNRDDILLLVVFDEHGGTHDHVPPPKTVPPRTTDLAASVGTGKFGFRFDRLGVRIPVLAISSYIEPGTVIRDQMQNTSVMRTLADKWDLPNLNERHKTAPSFVGVLNLDKPRESWPELPKPTVNPKDPKAGTQLTSGGLSSHVLHAAELAAATKLLLDVGEAPADILKKVVEREMPQTILISEVRERFAAAVKTLHS